MGGRARHAQETYLTRTAFGRLRCRDQLRHSLQVIGTLSLPPGEERAVQARGRRVRGAGPGLGRSEESGQVPGRSRGSKLAPDAPRRWRAAASVQCARAAAGVCVPAFPFLPCRSSGQTEPRAAAKARGERSGSTAGRSLAASRSGVRDRGARSRAPPSSGRGPGAERAGVRARRGEKAGCAAAAAVRGGCRPRPPAAQALPLFSPPPRSIPTSPAGKPDRFAAAAVRASAAVELGVRNDARGLGALSCRCVPQTESGDEAGPQIEPAPPKLQGWPGASRQYSKSSYPAKPGCVWVRAPRFLRPPNSAAPGRLPAGLRLLRTLT